MAVGVLLVAAAVVVRFVPFLLADDPPFAVAALLFFVRWEMAASILALAVGVLVRYAPRCPQRLPWVSLGTAGHRGLDRHVHRLRDLDREGRWPPCQNQSTLWSAPTHP